MKLPMETNLAQLPARRFPQQCVSESNSAPLTRNGDGLGGIGESRTSPGFVLLADAPDICHPRSTDRGWL